MKLVLRDYQEHAVQSISQYFASGKTGNPVIAMPTGTGKSLIIAGFLEWVYSQWPQQKILVVTHVKELIGQNYAKLMNMWPSAPAGIYSAGLGKKDIWQRIIFCGIGSVAKRAVEFGHVDLVIVDECHMINPTEQGQYIKFLDGLKKRNSMVKVIGLTATKWRLGHGDITRDGLFTDTCCDMTTMEYFNWFIGEGYLVPLIPRPTKTMFDLTGVHSRGGEFITGELQTAVNKPHLTNKALDEAIEMCSDRHRWLIFASGVEHADDVAKMLTEKGVICRSVHSKMSDKERDDVIAWFLEPSPETRAVSNNGVLTTGFDHPAIDLILMLRPTSSPVLWVQMLGRGTRPFFMPGYDLTTKEGRLSSIAASPKFNCMVLDYAGNTRRIGPINDPVLPKRKGEGSGEAPVKECDACQTLNHISARQCILCGEPFSFQTKLKMEASTQQIVKSVTPEIVELAVDIVRYDVHRKANSPDSVKVTYYCGYHSYSEWVCIDHTNYAVVKARQWLNKRGLADIVPPVGSDESKVRLLLDIAHTLPQPTHLRVWVNKQYPEIMAYCFDGSMFNKMPISAERPEVDVCGMQMNKPKPIGPQTMEEAFDAPIKAFPPDFSDMDDEIPF